MKVIGIKHGLTQSTNSRRVYGKDLQPGSSHCFLEVTNMLPRQHDNMSRNFHDQASKPERHSHVIYAFEFLPNNIV